MNAQLLTAAPTFVGREAELAALTKQLDAASAGAGSIALVAGEPGMGKSRLAEELAAVARARGVRVLWGRCYEGEGAPAFWPWIELLRAAVRGRHGEDLRRTMGPGAPDLAELVPEIRALLPDLPAPSLLDAVQARFRLFDAVTSFLFTDARGGGDRGDPARSEARPGLLLILDDLHWADAPSLLLLEFLARDLAGAHLLVLGTYRDLEVQRGHPLARSLGELARRPHVTRLVLGGLAAAEIARVVEQVAPGTTPSAGLVATLAGETAGNPLFVSEMVRLLVQEGRLAAWPAVGERGAAAPLPLPQTVREVIGRRLDRLAPACSEALTVAAVIGREFGVDGLARAGDWSAGALLGLLEEAETARVLEAVPGVPGRYRFSHALIRETLYEELPSARRARLHAQVGTALEAGYGPDAEPHVAELAHHFTQAAPAGEGEKAVAYSRRAGDRARARLAYEEAAAHYDRALHALEAQHPADDRLRSELLLALGDAQRLTGELHASKESFRRAAVLARQCSATDLLAHAALGYGAVFETGTVDAELVRLLEEALDALDETESALRVRLRARLATALYYTPARDRMESLSREAMAMARRLGDPGALAAALTARHWALLGPDGAEERRAIATELVQAGEASRNQTQAVQGHSWSVLDCLELGDLSAAEQAIAAVARLAGELRDPYLQWYTMIYQAMGTLLRGQFEEVERLAAGVLATGRRLQEPDAGAVYAVQLFALRREQGRLGELAGAVRDLVAGYPALPAWRAILAVIAAHDGDVAVARRELDHLASDGFAGLPRDLTWLTAVACLAEVCAALGDTDRAATLYHLLHPYAGRMVVLGNAFACYGAVTHYLGLLCATLGRWDEASRHFEDALAMHARMGARPFAARTQQAYAAMLLARREAEGAQDREADARQLDQARELAAQALTTARELGMARLADEAAALQTQRAALLPPAPPARPDKTALPDGLTAREVEVLRLLAAGKTNKEIADALVVSDRTVGRHLENVYVKIGARRRADAAAYALRHGLTLPES